MFDVFCVCVLYFGFVLFVLLWMCYGVVMILFWLFSVLVVLWRCFVFLL